jgi:ATP-dependent Clp protease ATP-binding subunit ClpA
MQLANQEAQRFNHEYIGTEHILLGLIKEGSGVAATVLQNLGVDLRKIRLEVEKLIQSGPDMITMGKLPQTPKSKRVIELSIEASRERNHNYVGTEHILIGLLREEEGVAFQVLDSLGVTEDCLKDIDTLLGVTRAVLEENNKTALQLAFEKAVRNMDFEEARRLSDELRKNEEGTSERHRKSLLDVTRALFVYVGDGDAKKALESISDTANFALTGEDPS